MQPRSQPLARANANVGLARFRVSALNGAITFPIHNEAVICFHSHSQLGITRRRRQRRRHKATAALNLQQPRHVDAFQIAVLRADYIQRDRHVAARSHHHRESRRREQRHVRRRRPKLRLEVWNRLPV